MKVVFVSNFMNHHQLPVALEMNNRFDYNFIATEPIADEQLNLGYEDMNKKYDFIIRAYESENERERAQSKIDNADVVIFGSCPYEMVEKRIKDNKLTFACFERLYRKGFLEKLNIKKFYSYYRKFTKPKNNYYLLTCSAYAAKDFAWFGAFKNKAFKWGYFTEVIEKNLDNLFKLKTQSKKTKILWCGRLIALKHPEYIIDSAKFLRNKNYNFEIKVVGSGIKQTFLEQQIKKNNLQNHVKLIGNVSANNVRKYMDEANIFMFNSDKREGWGAVVPESMNSACALICNKNIGSIPYLIKDGERGFIYKDKKEFLQKLEVLVKDKNIQKKFAINSYKFLKEKWNPQIAVYNFEKLLNGIKKGELNVIKEGPCSKA